MTDAILVTGGAGFIGSNFVLHWLETEPARVVNLDKLTYAGNLANLSSVENNERYAFVRGDVNDAALVTRLLDQHQPVAIVHFAAESHVDRSIRAADEFIRTNINGTFQLLQAAHCYWDALSSPHRERFRFLHVSTDEVYGSLGPTDLPFSEQSAYAPNSPYAASKAASEHLVRAYHHTYGLPTITSNCSNNYGPYQFPEKLIPLIIHNATQGKPLPVYGDGGNVRDWLYVIDHCEALRKVLRNGRVGDTYNIGGNSERTNIEIVRTICGILSELRPGGDYASLITFVHDRPGHDRRYAIDATKIRTELGWEPAENLLSGLRKTVAWYLDHPKWLAEVTSGAYREWMKVQYHQASV